MLSKRAPKVLASEKVVSCGSIGATEFISWG